MLSFFMACIKNCCAFDANVSDLFYAAMVGSKMYKMETSKIVCSLSYDEANKLTQLAGMLLGHTAMITSDRCAVYFSNIKKNSIMCADATKEINAKNMVRYFASV